MSSEFLLVLVFNSTNTVVAKCEHPTPLIPKPAIGHNPVLSPTIFHPTTYLPKIHFNVISFHLASAHFQRVFPTKMLHVFLTSPTTAHPITTSCIVIILSILGDLHKSQSAYVISQNIHLFHPSYLQMFS